MSQIRRYADADFPQVLEVINDAAEAYRGVIEDDCWHEPYMSAEELQAEIAAGVEFFCHEDGGAITGVMGIQELGEVTLIRHAYVRTANRRQGIGGRLLMFLRRDASAPILMGTWKAASWAVDFYEKHGFRRLSDDRSAELLRRYWNIPERQIETSVVLAGEDWPHA